MNKATFTITGIVITLATVFVVLGSLFVKTHPVSNGAPPYGIAEEEVPEFSPFGFEIPWQRPDGPARVGLQVGHWKNDEFPEELERLRGNTGASGGGKWEWEVNYAIARETAKLLEAQGIVVDILPATVPPDYIADVFLAIHADGSTDRSISGYKFASPWRDLTGKSALLVDMLDRQYGEITQLRKDDNITRNMRGYYAFAWWRFEHSVHPMTTSAIAETGFLTNYSDQQLLIYSPEIPASALALGIIEYLTAQGLVEVVL